IYEALKKNRWCDRWEGTDRRDEGHELGEPARPDVDRSWQRRGRAQHLHSQGRESGWRTSQRGIRDVQQHQGSARRSKMKGLQVIVAGGGIGGLSLALSLHQAGIDVRVYEAVRDPAEL